MNPPEIARTTILNAVRKALPTHKVDLPSVPVEQKHLGATGGFGYRGDLSSLEKIEGAPQPGQSLTPYFERQLAGMGGRSFTINAAAEIPDKVRELFPAARRICSVIPEISDSEPLSQATYSRSLADVDVAVVRSHLGVAEAGAVWLTDLDLIVPALGVLTQHLVVLLDPKDIVPTLHEAYGGIIPFEKHSYGVFMAGPSATGDIEGVIIHGAQGARTLTVLLLATFAG